MPLMTLETEKRLSSRKKALINRTMWIVTIQTVLSNISVFVEKGSPFLWVTLNTGFLNIVLLQMCPGKAAVRIMTVYTKNTTLPQWVVTWQGKLNFSGFMAGKTEFTGCHWRNFQIRTGVDIVAIKTGDLAYGVGPGVPVMQVKSCISRMAF